MTKPLALLDLDDTLFQTAKHIAKADLKHVATLDKAGQPLSFMTDIQLQFWQWLQASTEIIPVTARSIEGLVRVQLPLNSWAICQHGAVIRTPEGILDPTWAQHMHIALQPYQSMLNELCTHILRDCTTSIRAWVAAEFGQSIYIIIKKTLEDHTSFLWLVDYMRQHTYQHDFYIHINGNTMAILPNVVSKNSAVHYLLQRINAHNTRLVLGWGDSLSDLPFLQYCHWWGVPQSSQASHWSAHQLTAYIDNKGAYEYIKPTV